MKVIVTNRGCETQTSLQPYATQSSPSAIGTHASGVLAQNQHAGSVRTDLSLKGHYFE